MRSQAVQFEHNVGMEGNDTTMYSTLPLAPGSGREDGDHGGGDNNAHAIDDRGPDGDSAKGSSPDTTPNDAADYSSTDDLASDEASRRMFRVALYIVPPLAPPMRPRVESRETTGWEGE